MKTWLGKASREEAAKEIGISTLRFWQLSQQAVAGLVAGLLKQPRFRGGSGSLADPAEESAGVLRKKIAGLEKDLDGAQRLIALLKELPVLRAAGETPGAEHGDGRTSSRRRAKGVSGPLADAGRARGPGTEALGHAL